METLGSIPPDLFMTVSIVITTAMLNYYIIHKHYQHLEKMNQGHLPACIEETLPIKYGKGLLYKGIERNLKSKKRIKKLLDEIFNDKSEIFRYVKCLNYPNDIYKDGKIYKITNGTIRNELGNLMHRTDWLYFTKIAKGVSGSWRIASESEYRIQKCGKMRK